MGEGIEDGLYKDGDPERLIVTEGGKAVEVRWAFQQVLLMENGGDCQFLTGLAYDRSGNFYGVIASTETEPQVEKLTVPQALNFFAENASWDEAFTTTLIEAIEQSEFAFMGKTYAVKKTAKGKRTKSRRHDVRAVQLEMATTLVAAVSKLNASPNEKTLAEARRSATRLHQSLHAPEMVKKAGGAR
jgi:hypothetical protein